MSLALRLDGRLGVSRALLSSSPDSGPDERWADKYRSQHADAGPCPASSSPVTSTNLETKADSPRERRLWSVRASIGLLVLGETLASAVRLVFKRARPECRVDFSASSRGFVESQARVALIQQACADTVRIEAIAEPGSELGHFPCCGSRAEGGDPFPSRFAREPSSRTPDRGPPRPPPRDSRASGAGPAPPGFEIPSRDGCGDPARGGSGGGGFCQHRRAAARVRKTARSPGLGVSVPPWVGREGGRGHSGSEVSPRESPPKHGPSPSPAREQRARAKSPRPSDPAGVRNARAATIEGTPPPPRRRHAAKSPRHETSADRKRRSARRLGTSPPRRSPSDPARVRDARAADGRGARPPPTRPGADRAGSRTTGGPRGRRRQSAEKS